MSDQAAPAVEAAPAAVETPAATPPAPTGPWAAQLAERFPDPAQQAAIDTFLRETVQPHVTKLEQTAANLKDAQALYDDLQSAPGDTWVAITQELFGDDQAAKLVQAIQAGDVAEVVDNEGNAELQATTQLPREAQDAIDYVNAQRTKQEYDDALSQFIAANPDAKIEAELFHPFVAGAGGDFNVALAGYTKWATKWAETNGGAPVTAADVPDVAPPTLSGDAATTPPVQKTYGSLDEAMDDFFAENKAAPPVVGSV